MYGIALEGGGARGAYHIGALKAIIENGYEISGIVGTSIGSFNAAVVAQGDFDKLYELWTTSTTAEIVYLEEKDLVKIVNKKIDKDLIKNMSEYIKGVATNKGIDTAKYKEVVDSLVDEEKLRKSNVDFGLVTVSLTDKKPIELFKEKIEDGMISSYILASSYLPVFKTEKIQEKRYIDGGFYNSCPINMLLDKGYKNIIEIRTKAIGRYKKVKISDDVNVISISPSDDLGSILFADKQLAMKNINMGYYDALKVIKKLEGNKYYINSTTDIKTFDLLLKLTDEQIINIAECGVKEYESKELKKVLFEDILPQISRKLKLTKTKSYNELLIGIVEYLLEEEKLVELYNIYDLKELILEIKKNSSKMLRKEKFNLVRNTVKEMAITLIKEIDIKDM